MKYLKIRLVCLCTGICLLLTACSQNTFDAAAYVESAVESVYLGEHDNYEEFVGISQEEAEETYQEHLRSESMYFAEVFGFTQTDATLYRTMAFYRQLYNHSKFEAVSSEKMENGGYQVTMEISPVSLFPDHAAEIEKRVLDFSQMVSDGDFEGKSQKEIDSAYCNYLLNFLELQLENTGWESPKTITIELSADNNTYVISEKELMKIDEALVLYESGEES